MVNNVNTLFFNQVYFREREWWYVISFRYLVFEDKFHAVFFKCHYHAHITDIGTEGFISTVLASVCIWVVAQFLSQIFIIFISVWCFQVWRVWGFLLNGMPCFGCLFLLCFWCPFFLSFGYLSLLCSVSGYLSMLYSRCLSMLCLGAFSCYFLDVLSSCILLCFGSLFFLFLDVYQYSCCVFDDLSCCFRCLYLLLCGCLF